MRIGILGALNEEVAALRDDMRSPSESTMGVRGYWSGRIFGTDVTLTISRIGKVASASTATSLIAHYKVDAIVFVGVAGGIDPGLSIGDIVVATDLVQHDLDARPLFNQFEIPALGMDRIPTHPQMRHLAVAASRTFLSSDLQSDVPSQVLRELAITHPKVVQGLVASGDRFIHHGASVVKLRSDLPGIQCVEMEGAAVAQVCHEHNLPFVVIRVISDSANHEAKGSFTNFIKHAAGRYSRGILRNLLPVLDEQFVTREHG